MVTEILLRFRFNFLLNTDFMRDDVSRLVFLKVGGRLPARLCLSSWFDPLHVCDRVLMVLH